MIIVIGCGNLNRQDDGVGIEVIRALRHRNLEGPDVKLLDAGTDGMSVMFAARGCTSLIVVDASKTGVTPGAIHEVPGTVLERPYVPGLNLHDFRWDAALYAGRQIFREEFPTDVTVFLIEAAELGFGIGLSHDVAASAEQVSRRIEVLIGAMLANVPA
ncbi:MULTISPECIES: hydrogenase maturation protease [Mesorhizobium]|uniref:Hydrogenase maturation protease n=1 Tax=Rhizobium loti TaxID=381 RepID=A0A8E2WIX3_RHILI|nr:MULTISPECIES: hydrogenase maturation protease [Mesorhizobium]PWJ93836.1 hydrogenase maturation protease [Mesorhizobium loti]QKC82202.1 hydrogenase maturation protease [Mesorhizobium sp. NZP2077]QKD15677.1 hydrogenase maturation protease [Mesorhizobium sp. NZP2077]